MSINPIRVAVIGTGRISDLHAIEYLQNPASRIVALCDRDSALAEAKAKEAGIILDQEKVRIEKAKALDTIQKGKLLQPPFEKPKDPNVHAQGNRPMVKPFRYGA